MVNEDFYYIDISVVKKFLEEGNHPDNNTKPGQDSPLCFACMYNRTEIARLLIEAGADVNFKGSYGRIPLMYTAVKNNIELCELLLAKGADINAKNEGGDNILMDLNSGGKGVTEGTIRWLIDKGIDIHYRNDSINSTVLSLAVTFGKTELAKILIENGADGAIDSWHEKSFVASMDRPDDELAYNLLCNYKGEGVPGGVSAIIRAIKFQKNRIAKMMIEMASEKEKEDWAKEKILSDSLANAAYDGNLEMCQWLLDIGGDVNAGGLFHTPLQTASLYNKQEVVKLLLEHGAEIDKKDYKGNSSLILAASNGHFEIIKLLIAYGAELEYKDDEGNTALIIASAKSTLEIVKLLVESGSDIHAKNKLGWTPIMKASLLENSDFIKYLLEKGANANDKAENERNITALMLACDSRSVKKVKLLLTSGADPFAVDDMGLTAYYYAEFAKPNYKPEILKILPPAPSKIEYPRVDLNDCPICKGINNYESKSVNDWNEDYRKYFFTVMKLLKQGGRKEEKWRFCSETSLYECPRCGSYYKKYVTEDSEDTWGYSYELQVYRITAEAVEKLKNTI